MITNHPPAPEWLEGLTTILDERTSTNQLSESPLAAAINDLERYCTLLLGKNPLDSTNYGKTYDSIREGVGAVSQIIIGLPALLEGMELCAMSELVKTTPQNRLTDIDLLALRQVLVPVLRDKCAKSGLLHTAA